MALSLIDVGTTANDGTGDPLRTAFQTVNTALTAVNNAVVVGTGVTTFKDDSGTNGVAVASNGDVTFTNAGTTVGATWDASAVSDTGGLGLGTGAPSERLHIVGAARISEGIYTEKNYISDDTAISITNPGTICLIAVLSAGSSSSAAIFWCRTTGSPSVTTVSSAGTWGTTTGVLTGTTHTDGSVNVSAHSDGEVYVENRYGAALGFTVTLLAHY